MTPWAAQFIPEDDLALFERVQKILHCFESPDLGTNESGEQIVLSCHMLSRAFTRILPVSVRDGAFLTFYEHSWVETPSGYVIDVYPVGAVGGPLLYDKGVYSPKSLMFTRASAKKISKGRFDTPSFRRSVRRITKALEATAVA